MSRLADQERGTITKLLRDSQSRDRIWVGWKNDHLTEEQYADAEAKPDGTKKYLYEVGRSVDNGKLMIEVKYYHTFELIGNIFNFAIVPQLEPIRKGLKGSRRDQVLDQLDVVEEDESDQPKAKSQKKKQKTERSSVPVRQLPERRVRAQGVQTRGAD